MACSSILLALCLAACDQGQTPIGGFDDDGCDPSAGDGPALDVPAEPRPIVEMEVDCSFAFLDAIETFRLASGDGIDHPMGTLKVSAALASDDFEGLSFHVTVYNDEGTVGSTALYQLASGTRPVNEFEGEHGFTGLHTVTDPASGETLQYACFARDRTDPIDGWDE